MTCLVQILELYGRVLGFTDAAIQGIVHDDSFIVALFVFEDLKHKGHLLDVITADGSSAKTAGAMCRSVTVPAFHGGSPVNYSWRVWMISALVSCQVLSAQKTAVKIVSDNHGLARLG